jgi:hypothetical protein
MDKKDKKISYANTIQLFTGYLVSVNKEFTK